MLKQELKRLLLPRFLDSDWCREGWVVAELRKIPSGENILDAGAGEEKYKPYCTHLKYISQDFGKYSGGGADGINPKFWNASHVDVVSDITNIPVKSSSYDNVLCCEVLEHTPYPELAVKEFSRVLKFGGKLILTAPFCSQTHFSPYFYYTGFSRYWHKELLSKYGLKIQKIESNGNFFDYLSQEMLRLPLVFKQYSGFNSLAYLLYLIVLPLALMIYALGLISPGTERQLCFGLHIIATKRK